MFHFAIVVTFPTNDNHSSSIFSTCSSIFSNSRLEPESESYKSDSAYSLFDNHFISVFIFPLSVSSFWPMTVFETFVLPFVISYFL